MNNPRNAGRKPIITDDQLREIKRKREQGISVTKLAEEYGVSLQIMSSYLNTVKEEDINEIIYKTYKWDFPYDKVILERIKTILRN